MVPCYVQCYIGLHSLSHLRRQDHGGHSGAGKITPPSVVTESWWGKGKSGADVLEIPSIREDLHGYIGGGCVPEDLCLGSLSGLIPCS